MVVKFNYSINISRSGKGNDPLALTVPLDKNSLREGEGKEGISSNLSLFGLIDIMRESKSRDDWDPFNSLQILNFSSLQIGGIWKE